jgi:hypothetical protein
MLPDRNMDRTRLVCKNCSDLGVIIPHGLGYIESGVPWSILIENSLMEGYVHQVLSPDADEELLPQVHLVVSLLKRWLLGTHQGGVQVSHLDFYLDEFTFRFNRRKSNSRGLLFRRVLENAVQVLPVREVDLGKRG